METKEKRYLFWPKVGEMRVREIFLGGFCFAAASKFYARQAVRAGGNGGGWRVPEGRMKEVADE